jgi:hypothetical protein
MMTNHASQHRSVHFERLGHELTLAAVPVPSGAGVEILLGDETGMLAQEVMWLPNTEIEKRQLKGEDLVGEVLANARDKIAAIDDATLERILGTPRRREAFRWTPELLAAVHAIDWETRPVAGFSHHGHDFEVTACARADGVLIVMRDEGGVFDVSAWIAKEELGGTPMDDPNVLAFGADGLGAQITAMSESEFESFLASAARLPARPTALN